MKKRNYIWLTTAIVIAIWAVAAIVVDNEVKVPSPWATIDTLIIILTSKNFLVAVLATLRRALVGFIIAFILALVLGIAAGVSNAVFYLLRPIVLAQRSVPTMGVILLALIWMGRDIAPIFVCILVIFPLIYSAVVNGIRNVDQKLLEMTRVYHLSRKRKLQHLYMPSIRSSLMAVSKAAISLNLKITIAAEVLGQPGLGIGTEFQIEKATINTAGVVAWSIVAILLGAFLEYLVSPRFLSLFSNKLMKS